MVANTSAFTEENFDPKKWINSACKARHPQDSIEKHLVDLEMKLQVVSEEVAASLEEQSAAALLRVPRASRDIGRIREEASSLRSAVSSMMLNLKKADSSSAEVVAALSEVDTIKRRMESAYEMLQDAAGLKQLSLTVEDVFASGDLPRTAETLATMRHCLSAVGEVAEFSNVRKQLEYLENRLDTMIQPRLVDALTNRKIEAAQDLRGILFRIGRLKSFEFQYVKVQLKSIKLLWDDLDARQQTKIPINGNNGDERISRNNNFQQNPNTALFFTWLPNFYDKLLLYLEQEWKWCMNAFPGDYRSLVPKLLVEMMVAVSASFISHINVSTGDSVPETKAVSKGILDLLSGDASKGLRIHSKHLDQLIELHNTTSAFARNVQHLFSESDVSIVTDAIKSIYAPYDSFKNRYGQIERAILSSEISAVDLHGAASRGPGAQGVELSEAVRRMEESVPRVVVLLEASVERCILFTGGSHLDDLLAVEEEIILCYISMLHESLSSLKTVCGVPSDPSKGVGPAGRTVDPVANEEWSVIQGALQILTVSASLTDTVSAFEASLRSTLAGLCQNFAVPGPGRASFDVIGSPPEKARKLLDLFSQCKDPRAHIFPIVSQRVGAFSDAVDQLVYDVLVSKVRHRLLGVSDLPAWSSAEGPGTSPLPSFSAYPQAYAMSIGEYLLTLPQELEPPADGMPEADPGGDDTQFATEWMFKVAEGTVGIYMEQLCGIKALTERGAEQLSVDIEYLNNVLSALSVPVPPFMSTFYSRVSSVSWDEMKEELLMVSTKRL